MAKILLVDDEEIFREVIQEILSISGHEVVTAANGRLALDCLASQKVDLIISDIRMPEMDGIALLKAVRSQGQLPFILITGFSEILETKTAHELGANAFLPKPFKKEEMLSAIQQCLQPAGPEKSAEQQYCRLGINDFISGRTIKFNIFILISDKKYVKIAHKGEDISMDRIQFYREKGLLFLYLKREDFRKYVGFSLTISDAANRTRVLDTKKKLNLLRHTGEILGEQIRHDGIVPSVYESAAAFVETVLDVLTDDAGAVDLLEALNSHADYLLGHSVAVSLFSVLIAEKLNWNSPSNKFKIAMGGLLHDVGMKEIDATILNKPRFNWSQGEIKNFEDHPLRGNRILDDLNDIPDDIRDIVKQHHENCLSRGFPARVKKVSIHPMAKLISVADEFCYRTVRNPQHSVMSPAEALHDMTVNCAEQLDKTFLNALREVFE